mgnify:CR=1 FL=1
MSWTATRKLVGRVSWVLELCRGVVAAAFAEESGGLAMRDVPFDWEEEGAEGADTAVREV